MYIPTNKHIRSCLSSLFFGISGALFVFPHSCALVCMNCSQIETRIRIGGDELGYAGNPVQGEEYNNQVVRYDKQRECEIQRQIVGGHPEMYTEGEKRLPLRTSLPVLVRADLSLSCRCRVLKAGSISRTIILIIKHALRRVARFLAAAFFPSTRFSSAWSSSTCFRFSSMTCPNQKKKKKMRI